MKVQSHSLRKYNKIFLRLVPKHFGIFPLNEDATKFARNLSALVNGVLEQEASNNSSHLSYDVGSEQLPGWQAGGITPLCGGTVRDVHCTQFLYQVQQSELTNTCKCGTCMT